LFRKGSTAHEFTRFIQIASKGKFRNISAGDVNLRRGFLVVRTILNITAAAAVTTIFARVFFGIVRVFIILIFGRRLRRLNAFPSLFFSINLKE
jgi:hypothetical protein